MSNHQTGVTPDLLEQGIRHEYWLPFTPNKEFKSTAPKMAVCAEGIYYWDVHGNRILDAASGLFCVAAGHARPEIAAAVQRQADRFALSRTLICRSLT